MPYVTANGAQIPALGFGTYRMDEAAIAAVLPDAIRKGFRHVDTAQVYGNEAAVGAALRASGVPRDEMFLTTKVWVDSFEDDRFMPSVDESLRKLGVDHVDLLLLHWPGGSDVPMEDRHARLAEAQRTGRTRHVGVSNYTIAQMRAAAAICPIVTNQVEFHPWLDQSKLLAAAREDGLSLTAYYAMADGRSAKDAALAEIGRSHGKSAAQIALRWLVQQDGVIALSKTANPARVPENLEIFDFVLTKEEMARIDAMGSAEGRIVAPGRLAPDWD
ncbi:aldo/keto reductase [Falsirhodobacter algicola]|uniref:Aldo/keto reductase n=1 Tax=Falsirhodobacter algicola TaxID=2692330 RepID=A0A8J8SLY4_9RHOB|nr:aldo/keto reductase [Falsirhodobacter algicola]